MPAQTRQLMPHPAHPPSGVEQITLRATRDGSGLRLVYDVIGDMSAVVLPVSPGGKRRDELWKHTCFEAFIRAADGDGYVEYNLAPNGNWAAYAFSGYRADMRALAESAPRIETASRAHGLSVNVRIPALPAAFATGQIRLGASAIIEDKTGARSYWALHHPPDAPDFHHAGNFKMRLD